MVDQYPILTILPPIIAIISAIVTRRVVLSLGLGVVLAALLVENFNPLGTLSQIWSAFAVIFWDSEAGRVNTDQVVQTWRGQEFVVRAKQGGLLGRTRVNVVAQNVVRVDPSGLGQQFLQLNRLQAHNRLRVALFVQLETVVDPTVQVDCQLGNTPNWPSRCQNSRAVT